MSIVPLLALLSACVAVVVAPDPPTDDFVLVGGDMLMPKAEFTAFKTSHRRHKRMATSDESKRWKNATIYYTVALTYYSERELEEMQWALDQYEKETCLKFRTASLNTPNYAVVRLGSGGCNAILGQGWTTPAAQSVNLGSGCRHYGLYLHEFGHTIGLYHEHQHPDRDLQLKITMENVAPAMREWFEPESEPFSTFGAPYDVQSIMHYGENAFSKDGKSITMQTKDPKRQRHLTPVWMKDMSYYDAWKINAMYKCASHCKNKCPSDEFMNKDCKCVNKHDFAKRRCIDMRDDCPNMKDRCESENYWMWKYCRKTCERCYIAE